MADLFRALADDTRRALLDRLRAAGGQTLGQLCSGLPMTRQAVTRHLALLEEAGLVVVVRRGRERLHYLNPVPLKHLRERWVGWADEVRLSKVAAIVAEAERKPMENRPDYVYVTYVRATAQQVWEALTNAELTARFWGHRNESDWAEGSDWRHVRTDGSGIADVVGRVLRSEPPHLLALSFGAAAPDEATVPVVTFTIDEDRDIVRLAIVHEHLRTAEDREAVALGWPAVAANLKSLLETGSVLPHAPWEFHADARKDRMAGVDGSTPRSTAGPAAD